jgi:hypothetical protein
VTESIQGSSRPQPIARGPGAANAAQSSSDGSAAIRFQAMLDQIQRSAEQLKIQSGKELSRTTLGSAVEEARTSLEQALSLKDRLLEEWRATRQRGA